MQYLRIFTAILLLTIGVTACSKTTSASSASWHDSEGHPVSLSSYKGKWVLINYWASWCGACADEVPELNMFYFAHKDKDAMVFGVNYDHASPNMLPMLAQRMGIMFPTLQNDPASEFGVGYIPAIPITLLIDPQGKLKHVLTGEQTQQSLEQAIASARAEKK